jgi:hypothetical protein
MSCRIIWQFLIVRNNGWEGGGGAQVCCLGWRRHQKMAVATFAALMGIGTGEGRSPGPYPRSTPLTPRSYATQRNTAHRAIFEQGKNESISPIIPWERYTPF